MKHAVTEKAAGCPNKLESFFAELIFQCSNSELVASLSG